MIALAIGLNAILGGVWRRVLGGWGGFRRSHIVAVGFPLTWPAWVALPWWGAALASAAIMAFFTLGHRFDEASIVLRYPWIGVLYRIGARYWPSRYTEIAEIGIGALVWGAFAFLLAVG